MKKFVSFYKKHEKTITITLISLITIYGFILRILYLEKPSLWIDEIFSSVAARGILEHGYPLLESGATYFRAVLFHYLMAFFLLIWNNDFGARFVSVLFGVGSIILAYYYGKLFSDKSIKLLFPLLIAVSSISIIFSKQARMYAMFQFFFYLSILFYYHFKQKNEVKYMYWCLISLLILCSTHLLGVVLVPIILLYELLFYRTSLRKVIVLSSGFVIASLYIFYKISIGFNQFSYNAQGYYFSFTLYIPFFILAILGFVYSFKENKKLHALLGLSVIIPIFGVFFVEAFGTRYVYYAFFIIFLYLALALSKIPGKYFVVIGVILLFSGTIFAPLGIQLPNLDASMPVSNYKIAYASLSKDIPVIESFPPAGKWYNNGSSYWLQTNIQRGYLSWMSYNGYETWSNATPMNSTSFSHYYVILDAIGLQQHKATFENCSLVVRDYNIDVRECENTKK